MKKIWLSVVALSLFAVANAQHEYKKHPALSVNFNLYDFKTAADIRTNGLSSVLRSKDWKNTARMRAGFSLGYMEGISNHVDFHGTLSGAYVEYPIENKPAAVGAPFLLDATAEAHLKLMTDKYWVSPFVSLGVGASHWDGYFSAFIPAGVGLQVNFWDEAFLLLRSQYRVPVTENGTHHLMHSIGFAANIFKRKAK